LSRLVEFLDPTDPEGLHARSHAWCEVCRGDYAWVFDNSRDTRGVAIGRPLGHRIRRDGIIDHSLTRPPITLYLFHLVRQLLDGRASCVGWMSSGGCWPTPLSESFAKDGPKTWPEAQGA